LETPMIDINDDQRVGFKQTLSGLVKELHGDRSKVHLDALLRLPGTLNIKDSPPQAVKVMSLTNMTYRLKDFDRFKSTAYEEREAFMGILPAFGTRTATIIGRDEISVKECVEKLEISPKTKNLIITGEMQPEEDADQTRSGRDFSIICSLIRRGYDYPTIKSIFFNPFLKCSDRITFKGERSLQWDVGSALIKVGPKLSGNTQSSPATTSEEQLQVRCAADIEPEEISWLWPERFPLGKLSLIVGDPVCGKSLFCTWMLARVSSGKAWPDGSVPPVGKVIYLQCEDDAADTIVPRLIQHGADLHKVCLVEGVKTKQGGDRVVSLLTDLEKLEDLIRLEREVKLVIIDPLQAHFGAGLRSNFNPHADSHIRDILTPVKKLAEKYDVAFVGVVHLNKNDQKDMMYRVGGSIALVGLPRSIWLLQWDGNPFSFRYLLSMKSNWRAGISGLAFLIDPNTGEVSFHDDIPVPNAAELLSSEIGRRPREVARTYIKEQLKNGARNAKEILAEAEQKGINRATLFAAKKELKIESKKTEGEGRHGKSMWLPPVKSEENKLVNDLKARINTIQERVKKEETQIT
jgi:putative DNA primase/helicase